MMRWNIKQILIYSHDNQSRIIDFDIGKVNIITGNSRTGKSTIIEIIDYVMGASQCQIARFVRNSCSWVGVLWSNRKSEFLLCRKVPAPGRQSSSDYYFDVANKVSVPKSSENLIRNIDKDGALRKFEQLLAMGEVKSEPFASGREPQKISLRHVIPYLLQDDDVIINKTDLFRLSHQDGQKDIIDRIPYFVGVTDEETVRKEITLRQLRARLRSLEKQANDNNNFESERESYARSLLTQAVQVGLVISIPNNVIFQDMINILRNVITWTSDTISSPENDQLSILYGEKQKLQTNAEVLRSQINSAEHLLNQSDRFNEGSNSQKRRLEVVNLIPSPNGTELCPICNHILDDEIETIANIKTAFKYVQNELQNVERERPQLESYIQERQSEILSIQDKLVSLNRQITAIVTESERMKQILDLDQRRHRIIGGINFYLNLAQPEHNDRTDDEVEELKKQIEILEEEVSKEEKLQQLSHIQTRLSNNITKIVAELPFEERYKNDPIDFSLRNLSIGVVTSHGRVTMREIGSDQNYLTLHVAVLTALHRHFAEIESPVPGVILFDQLSRPFYPQDEYDERVINSELSQDEQDLKLFFDFLFREVNQEENLQVIILEHAFFSKDDRFVKATKQRWIGTNTYLIPSNWPELNE